MNVYRQMNRKINDKMYRKKEKRKLKLIDAFKEP